MTIANDDTFSKQVESHKKWLGKVPDHTCGTIDSALKDLKDAMYDAKNLQKNIEDIDHTSHMISYNIDSACATLEQLRKENEQLRDLGKEWYLFAKKLAEDYDKYCEYTSIEIADLQNEIKMLQSKLGSDC